MPAKLLFLMLLIGALVGCSPTDSINPLFASKDANFDQGLLGMWGEKDSSPKDGYILFEKGDDNGYRITIANGDGEKREFKGYLGYVHGLKFLDVAPVPANEQWSALADADLTINRQSPDTPTFQPALVKLGDAAYLEFADAGSDAGQAHFKLNLRTAHWFCKVATAGSTMQLDCLDDEWTTQHIDDPGVRLAHQYSSDRNSLVVTASTADLQRFVTEQADNKEAFSWSMTAEHLDKKQ